MYLHLIISFRLYSRAFLTLQSLRCLLKNYSTEVEVLCIFVLLIYLQKWNLQPGLGTFVIALGNLVTKTGNAANH